MILKLFSEKLLRFFENIGKSPYGILYRNWELVPYENTFNILRHWIYTIRVFEKLYVSKGRDQLKYPNEPHFIIFIYENIKKY